MKRLLKILGAVVGFSLDQIIIAAGAFTVISTVYVVLTLPDFFIRFRLGIDV